MSATRTLAGFASRLRFEDLPKSVVEKGELVIIDALGNAIGGYTLGLAETFMDLAKDIGDGRPEASLIGDGTKVCVPLAAFGNGALSTMLDSTDSHAGASGKSFAWIAATAVPAALAAGESRNISGKDLIASVVAGYEVAARVVLSMDRSAEQSQKVLGSTASVFSAVGAAARALGLDEDQYLSALGMAGVYTPVPSQFKYVFSPGNTPRRDIKQGWSWMSMTGTFAAVSAQQGLNMLQENNILDGDRGLSTMMGMDIYNEEQITAEMGQTYHIQKFSSKYYPGGSVTHTPIAVAQSLVREHGIEISAIEAIDISFNSTEGVGLDDRDPQGLVSMEFSIPYQVSAGLIGGDPGPKWYSDRLSKSPELKDLIKRVTVSPDEECDKALRERRVRMAKISVRTKDGKQYGGRTEQGGRVSTAEEVKGKFTTTTSQAIRREQLDNILNTVENLESVERVSHLIDLLGVPLPQGQ